MISPLTGQVWAHTMSHMATDTLISDDGLREIGAAVGDGVSPSLVTDSRRNPLDSAVLRLPAAGGAVGDGS